MCGIVSSFFMCMVYNDLLLASHFVNYPLCPVIESVLTFLCVVLFHLSSCVWHILIFYWLAILLTILCVQSLNQH